jgi:NADPH:quinone reductase-like Zn-dependent oxidoreductase
MRKGRRGRIAGDRRRTPAQHVESAERVLADLLPAFADGSIRRLSTAVFPLDEIAPAGAYLETDQHVGKVVLQISGPRFAAASWRTVKAVAGCSFWG